VDIEATMASTESPVEDNLNATVMLEFPIGQNTQLLPQSSYASMVDRGKGTDLYFIPSSLINGVKCAKVELDDVQQEIDYWQHAVFCQMLGGNPLFVAM